MLFSVAPDAVTRIGGAACPTTSDALIPLIKVGDYRHPEDPYVGSLPDSPRCSSRDPLAPPVAPSPSPAPGIPPQLRGEWWWQNGTAEGGGEITCDHMMINETGMVWYSSVSRQSPSGDVVPSSYTTYDIGHTDPPFGVQVGLPSFPLRSYTRLG